VTPGSTAPDASLTMPAMPLVCCAHTAGCAIRTLVSTNRPAGMTRTRTIYASMASWGVGKPNSSQHRFKFRAGIIADGGNVSQPPGSKAPIGGL
jgi:hypothetical protein